MQPCSHLSCFLPFNRSWSHPASPADLTCLHPISRFTSVTQTVTTVFIMCFQIREGRVQRSKTVKSSNNPVFNQEFFMVVDDFQQQKLSIKVRRGAEIGFTVVVGFVCSFGCESSSCITMAAAGPEVHLAGCCCSIYFCMHCACLSAAAGNTSASQMHACSPRSINRLAAPHKHYACCLCSLCA